MSKSLLRQVGKTTDGKIVVKGVFRFFETNGLPLAELFIALENKNIMVSWIDFYMEALSAGIDHDRIISRLEEAISDCWGESFFFVVKYQLEKLKK